MEGLISLLGITLVMIDLCATTYLIKSFMRMIFKLMELKEFIDNAEN
ncbi:MAG: hypothetical protein HDR30_05700 [Lachnospiraceae bacterium]|nr:hypothetical protein [Lachnospiraceae bacterium]